MISRCAFLSIGLMAVCLMVASVFAAEAEDGAGGAAKNEARLLVGKHVRYLSLLYLLKLYLHIVLTYFAYKLQRRDHLIKQDSNY